MKPVTLLYMSFLSVLACVPARTTDTKAASNLKTITVQKPTAEKLRAAFGENCSDKINKDAFIQQLKSADSSLSLDNVTDLCPLVESLLDRYYIHIFNTDTKKSDLEKTSDLNNGKLSESVNADGNYEITISLFSSKLEQNAIFTSTLELKKEVLQKSNGALAFNLQLVTSEFAKTVLGFSDKKITAEAEVEEKPEETTVPPFTPVEPEEQPQANFVAGKAAFAANCGSCHIAEEKGANKDHIEGATESDESNKIPDRMLGFAYGNLDKLSDADTIRNINLFLTNRAEGEF